MPYASALCVPSATAGLKAGHRYAALPGVHFRGKFPKILSGHGPFHCLQQRGGQGVIVSERFRAIVDLDPSTFAKELGSKRSHRCLETSPMADIEDENGLIIGLGTYHVPQELP